MAVALASLQHLQKSLHALTVDIVDTVDVESFFCAHFSFRFVSACLLAACASGFSSSGHSFTVWPSFPQFQQRTLLQRSLSSAVDLAFMLDRISCFRTLVSSSGWSVVHSAVVWLHHPWCEQRSAVLRIGAYVGADDDTLNAVDMIFVVVDVIGIVDIVDESSYVLVGNGQIEFSWLWH